MHPPPPNPSDLQFRFLNLISILVATLTNPDPHLLTASFEGGYEEALSVARLKQLGACFSFTRANVAAVPVKHTTSASAAAASPPGTGNRGPGGGRSYVGPAKPGAQRILDAMSLSTLWVPKVCVCVCVFFH